MATKIIVLTLLYLMTLTLIEGGREETLNRKFSKFEPYVPIRPMLSDVRPALAVKPNSNAITPEGNRRPFVPMSGFNSQVSGSDRGYAIYGDTFVPIVGILTPQNVEKTENVKNAENEGNNAENGQNDGKRN